MSRVLFKAVITTDERKRT